MVTKLDEYISQHYGGNKAKFAEDFGLYRQNVNSLIKKGVIVIDGQLYRPLAKWKRGNHEHD